MRGASSPGSARQGECATTGGGELPAAAAQHAAPDLDLVQRQLLALNSDIPLSDWEANFVAEVCWRKPDALTPRQVQMVAVICWRRREHLPAELVPATEPKLSAETAFRPDNRDLHRRAARRP